MPAARMRFSPSPAVPRIGILTADDDPRERRSCNQVRAGGAARRGVRAGLERDVERAPARMIASGGERHGLGMGAATGLGPAAGYRRAVAHDQRADGGVGTAERAAARARGWRRRPASECQPAPARGSNSRLGQCAGAAFGATSGSGDARSAADRLAAACCLARAAAASSARALRSMESHIHARCATDGLVHLPHVLVALGLLGVQPVLQQLVLAVGRGDLGVAAAGRRRCGCR